MTLFAIYYHNGNEYDFDHIVAENSEKATSLFEEEYAEYGEATIHGVYSLEQVGGYNVTVTKA